MFLLVLRLLAVYFATCAVSLWLAHRFVSPLRLSVGLFLAIAPFLLTGKAMLTAGVYAPLDIAYQALPLAAHRQEQGIEKTRTPILGDVVFQEIPWRKAVREAMKNGRLPLWNRFQLAGEPLLAVQQPAVLHPATWIGLLLPLAQAWTFEMALRHFLAILAAYLFLRHIGCGELPALAGAAGWAFCDYLVFFAGYPLSAAAAPFPLLLLGLARLVSDPGRRAVALTVAALLLIVTSGHPETLLHAVAGAGVFFLFELGFAGSGRRLRPLLLSILSGGIALGLSAVLLLPLAEALPHTAEHALRTGWYAHVDKSVSVAESLRRSIQHVVPYAFGVSGQGRSAIGFGEPAAYTGALLLPFAVLGLFSPRREKWPVLLVGFLGAASWARLPGVTDAISGLPLFDIGLNERLVFLAAFAVAALAALGADRMGQGKGSAVFLGAAIATAAAATALHLQARPTLLRLGMEEEFLRGRFLLLLLPLLLLAAVSLVFARRKLPAVFLGAALLLLLVSRRFEAGSLYPTFPSRAFYPDLEVVKPVPRDAPYRFTSTSFTFIPNVSVLYELEDVRGYEAMTFAPLTETFPLWCVPQPVWFNRVDDPTRPFLAFLGVRYVLLRAEDATPPGWKTLAEGEGTRLVENPAALERAFVPRLLRYEESAESQRTALGEIGDFGEMGVVEADAGTRGLVGQWTRNGRVSVSIESYRPQSLVLSVDAAAEAVVATSVTRWPGWKLEVNGRRERLLTYNRAFLAFRVPAGRHRAVLRYLPDGFVWGSAISGLTAAACVIALLARRGRRARGEP